MPPRDIESVNDMLQAALLAADFVAGQTHDAFHRDRMRQAAVIREIEIIGEAARRLTDEYRAAHPQIPWSKIIGMRNILIHAYDHVDPDEVWEVTQQYIPQLIQSLQAMLAEE